MNIHNSTTSEITTIFARAVIQRATGKNIHVSKTAMQASGVQVSGRHRRLCRVWRGLQRDYDPELQLGQRSEDNWRVAGEDGAAPQDIPQHTGSDEIRQSIGELTNQCVGKRRSLVQEKYGLFATANIPVVVPIAAPITLSMVSKEPKEFECVRVPSTTEKLNKFYMELALEPFSEAPLNL